MYVIVGANGFLGSYLLKNILEKTDENILAVSNVMEDMEESERIKVMLCDVTKQDDVIQLNQKMKEYGACKVIYLAAYHNPDLVEKNPKIAWNVNINALAYFLNTIEPVKCLFYPSTDTVYGEGGIDIHFKESDELKPVNLYGKHKALAEKMIVTYGYNVVRYPFLIGPSLVNNKKHFYDQIVENISCSIPMDMYQDSMRSSLDFNQAAGLMLELIEHYTADMPQIINVSGDQDLSKYDVGLMLADKVGVSRDLIIPVSVNQNSEIFVTPRASSTLLDNTILKQVLGLEEVKIKL